MLFCQTVFRFLAVCALCATLWCRRGYGQASAGLRCVVHAGAREKCIVGYISGGRLPLGPTSKVGAGCLRAAFQTGCGSEPALKYNVMSVLVRRGSTQSASFRAFELWWERVNPAQYVALSGDVYDTSLYVYWSAFSFSFFSFFRFDFEFWI